MDVEEFQQKIDDLSDIDFSLPSEVEVALDDLASYLIVNLGLKSNKFKWRTPSLFDVIQVLVDEEKLPKEATELAADIKYLLKQVYGDEFDEEDAELLARLIEHFQELLTEALIDE